MKHVGDVTKLNGAELPVVDCITFGAPCQDISVAGRRAGMKHEGRGDDETTRSGLFFEALRIIKEMREHDRDTGRSGQFIRPRWAIYENVPGALSSPGRGHKGEDFAAVIEEFIKVAEPGADVHVCVPDGGWPNFGCYYAEDRSWSLAWRVHDGQYWGATQYADDRVLFLGTPQRRRRIALVADFGGLSAPEVLVECQGVSRDSDAGREAGQGTPAGTQGRIGDAISFQERAGKPGGGKGILIQNEHTGALSTLNIQHVFDSRGINGNVAGTLDASYYKGCGTRQGVERDVVLTEPIVLEGNQNHATITQKGISPTLPASMGMGGGYIPSVVEPLMVEMTSTKNTIIDDGISCTLTARMGTGGNQVNAVLPFDTTQITHPANYSHPKPGDPCHPLAAGAHPPAVAIGNGQLHNISMAEVSNTLDTMHDAQAVMVPDVAHALKSKANCDFREDSETYVATAVDCRNCVEDTNVNGTLQAKSNGGFNVNSNNVCRVQSTVRRLTPLECERLQGYPDFYTDIGEWVDSDGKTRKCADTNRYKALGNSICLPFWFWLLRRISAKYERPATLGSLFDGIGGFPLCWERCNGKGTALWASEVEEFCIAVTKKHFPEE